MSDPFIDLIHLIPHLPKVFQIFISSKINYDLNLSFPIESSKTLTLSKNKLPIKMFLAAYQYTITGDDNLAIKWNIPSSFIYQQSERFEKNLKSVKNTIFLIIQEYAWISLKKEISIFKEYTPFKICLLGHYNHHWRESFIQNHFYMPEKAREMSQHILNNPGLFCYYLKQITSNHLPYFQHLFSLMVPNVPSHLWCIAYLYHSPPIIFHLMHWYPSSIQHEAMCRCVYKGITPGPLSCV